MATDIILPKIGFSMSEGELIEWFVEDGGVVTEGAPLYSIESEKAVQEVEASASGTLKIIAGVGQTYDVGAVLGQIV